jgi:hypothetical protein
MKNLNFNLNLASLTKPFKTLFRKFHLTLFIIVAVAGLAGTVIFLNDLLKLSSLNDGYTSPIGAGSIDQATLDRLKELHTSTDAPTTNTLPSGRTNPFSE